MLMIYGIVRGNVYDNANEIFDSSMNLSKLLSSGTRRLIFSLKDRRFDP